ncbi:unnamed protein product [Paramecium sonneborni]|uniref:Uncharacterized protein n=1 Tax=Paramecium sonneborni TaxID=65129 RepID=A0A8S1QZ50_9CILI|nr:unnamed protein product [Paramecium sonneborni]
MSLSWLVSPKLHKTTNGYFINHENIKIRDDQYFIILQVRHQKRLQKMITQNTSKRNSQMLMSDLEYSLLVVYFALATMRELITSRITNRPILNDYQIWEQIIFNDLWQLGLVSAAFSYNLSQILFEPLFVQRNQVISDLSEKYNFSVFDFALAKKEARLKQLRTELTSDSSNAAHF